MRCWLLSDGDKLQMISHSIRACQRIRQEPQCTVTGGLWWLPQAGQEHERRCCHLWGRIFRKQHQGHYAWLQERASHSMQHVMGFHRLWHSALLTMADVMAPPGLVSGAVPLLVAAGASATAPLPDGLGELATGAGLGAAASSCGSASAPAGVGPATEHRCLTCPRKHLLAHPPAALPGRQLALGLAATGSMGGAV